MPRAFPHAKDSPNRLPGALPVRRRHEFAFTAGVEGRLWSRARRRLPA
jgi:hypothetical protein